MANVSCACRNCVCSLMGDQVCAFGFTNFFFVDCIFGMGFVECKVFLDYVVGINFIWLQETFKCARQLGLSNQF